jgi:protein phosphatase
MKIRIPDLSLVVLIGPSGSGKSTFARRHFAATEILSSDLCRGLVSDDENDQSATSDAFDVLNFVADKRLQRGRLTVIDATNVQKDARAPLVALARKRHVLPVAIVLNVGEALCHERNQARTDRAFGPHVIRNQVSQLRKSLKDLRREGFRNITVLRDQAEIDSVTIERQPLWNDLRHDTGPFDIVGDIHGCADELELLLAKLGYSRETVESPGVGWNDTSFRHPEGRKAVFLGDLVDRGPRVLDTVSIVRNMVQAGTALCVPGNHDIKLLRKLAGKDVRVNHGLENTLAEIENVPAESAPVFRKSLADFLDKLISHYVLDGGKLVVAHAGLKQEMQGRGSSAVREFALFGETTGETDEFGLPVRYDWAASYRGPAAVVYGHTPVPDPEWLNNTVNVDTGCVFGGKLTALRYPEREFVAVPAAKVYCEPVRPLKKPDEFGSGSAQQSYDDLLNLEDVVGKRLIPTRLMGNLTIRAENSTAALEVMSRFAVDPKWLIYLPPTISPGATSPLPDFLEHPAEVFGYYRSHGVPKVICETKHMGSRAIVIVCRDSAVARSRFGVSQDETGIVLTRTGRRFFADNEMECALLDRVRSALDADGFWDDFETDWVCLDCELMPWSAKALELIRTQYAAVGASGTSALRAVQAAMNSAAARIAGTEREKIDGLIERFGRISKGVDGFVTAYRSYCWPVTSIDDSKLAPFHILATEGRVHVDLNHEEHLKRIGRFCDKSTRVLTKTEYRIVDVTDESSMDAGIAWWSEMTSIGGEGMVVKPLDWITRDHHGLVQPAVKCRGPEYLRIIYGPDYDSPNNLERLKRRSLAGKRSLALREFALGIEGLERFVRKEPLRRVHECVFGVLALESEPVDPRL